ncbi:hypothetical protein CMQ_4304 [Grosmannia clavigera kw1407]|uniref:Uncharacterized protein n=1 Tax=Grosmannia clavigera (strain kw1407 / UAMH 11150) TaxID=655863 RepID=F0XUN3_GROCL|nr:uncharacterized protein CMQ_4304 [Grosmannia clavigera kw1407]EFW98452.1 hypothetical protein CMQ_4304 [Grosmannia clavigera kw1407]
MQPNLFGREGQWIRAYYLVQSRSKPRAWWEPRPFSRSQQPVVGENKRDDVKLEMPPKASSFHGHATSERMRLSGGVLYEGRLLQTLWSASGAQRWASGGDCLTYKAPRDFELAVAKGKKGQEEKRAGATATLCGTTP